MKRLCASNQYIESYFNNLENTESVTHLFYSFLNHISIPRDVSVPDDDQKTIKFLVTIRTDYTNEVLVPEDGKFFTNCTQYYPNEHPLDDTIMLAAQKLVLDLFDCGEHLVEFIPRTTVYPVGACFVDSEPYVYVNVVIDHTLFDEEHFKLKNCRVSKIESIIPKNHLEYSLLSSLAIVRR